VRFVFDKGRDAVRYKIADSVDRISRQVTSRSPPPSGNVNRGNHSDSLGVIRCRPSSRTEPEESKRHYLAAGCTRDGIRLMEVLYFKLTEAVGPTPRTLA